MNEEVMDDKILVYDSKEKKVVPVSDLEDKGEVILREEIEPEKEE